MFSFKEGNAQNPTDENLYRDSGSDSDSVSDDTPTPSPSPKHSRAYTVVDEQAYDILRMLRQSIDFDEWRLKEENKFDNATQSAHIDKIFARENQEDEDEDKFSAMSDERKDEIRIARLEESRPKWVTYTLKVAFHVFVFVNFVMSWNDSVRLILEDAKMNLWLLEDDYNCLEIVPNTDWLSHTMNILLALMSCSVIYVYNRKNATLCLACICSQAVHTVIKTFQYFHNLKFERNAFLLYERFYVLCGVILLDVFSVLLLLQKYYDLTDRFKTKAKHLGAVEMSERSLNDKIIHKNNTPFLQRKTILREVTTAQTFAIIKKIGKHMKQGLRVDPMTLNREIIAAKMALSDCATAENHNMLYMLRKAYAHRLKELENEEAAVNPFIADSDLFKLQMT